MATDSSHKKRTLEKMWEAQQPAAPHIWKKDRMTNDPKKSFFISAREIGRVMKSPGRFQVVPS